LAETFLSPFKAKVGEAGKREHPKTDTSKRPELSETGLVRMRSHGSVKATIDRLEAALRAAGVGVFARIDHAVGATSVGMKLRPTELLIFGNPRAGTPLMQAKQTIGLDLPLKVLAWEDTEGKVWVTYNDPAWLEARHGLGETATGAVQALAGALAKFVEAATAG
jgi:uncharacterized protein (DUF302 family)